MSSAKFLDFWIFFNFAKPLRTVMIVNSHVWSCETSMVIFEHCYCSMNIVTGHTEV